MPGIRFINSDIILSYRISTGICFAQEVLRKVLSGLANPGSDSHPFPRHWLPDMRRSAAESLGDLARASDEHIVKALSEALREEGDAEARLAMAEALGTPRRSMCLRSLACTSTPPACGTSGAALHPQHHNISFLSFRTHPLKFLAQEWRQISTRPREVLAARILNSTSIIIRSDLQN